MHASSPVVWTWEFCCNAKISFSDNVIVNWTHCKLVIKSHLSCSTFAVDTADSAALVHWIFDRWIDQFIDYSLNKLIYDSSIKLAFLEKN